MWYTIKEFASAEIAEMISEKLPDIKQIGMEEIKGLKNPDLIFSMDYPNYKILEKLKSEKNKNSIYIILLKGNITSTEKCFYAESNIFLFDQREFANAALTYTKQFDGIEKLQQFVSKKSNKMIRFFKEEKTQEMYNESFLPLIFEYHYTLISAVNKFLDTISERLGLDPHMALVFLKEDAKHILIGNTGELILKKDYDKLPEDIGKLQPVSDFDYFLIDTNALEKTPEFRYTVKIKRKKIEVTMITYFTSLPLLDLEKQGMLKEALEQLTDFLIEFGLTGNIKETSFKRLLKMIESWENTHNRKNHSRNVSAIAAHMGSRLNFSKGILKDLRISGRLHDIGKLLLEEDEEKKIHPRLGALILNKLKGFDGIGKLVLNHHKGRRGNLNEQVLYIADLLENSMRGHTAFDPKALIKEGIKKEIIAIYNSKLVVFLEGLKYE
ncbi:HD domain-containing protein [bacterium]|nr:HD domain-containing protein [bacterium]